MLCKFELDMLIKTINKFLIDHKYITEDNLFTGLNKLNEVNIDSLDLMYLVLVLTEKYKEISLLNLEPIDLLDNSLEDVFNQIKSSTNT